MSDLIIKRGPTEFDHLVLGTADTAAGAAWLGDLTGAEVINTEPEPGQWYWSAALPLDHGAMIEVLGPNPAHRGFHPMNEVLRAYSEPRPMFWHIGTRDLEALRRLGDSVGTPIERIEHLASDTPHGRRVYSRGVFGPGFRSVRPCVIQWIERPERPGFDAPVCAATAFRVTDPDPSALNLLFDRLGLALRASGGPQAMEVDLTTPKGPVTLAGPGETFEGLGALTRVARLWAGHLMRRIARR